MIEFLYTNIGRGHPFYLDGIIETLRQKNFSPIKKSDVFEISRGQSLAAWNLARQLYNFGSTDSVIGKWYNKFRDRSEYDKSGLVMKLMGRDLAKKYIKDDTPLVVAHPVLVGILKGKKNLFYQHGEIAVPGQAVVKGADCVFVPTDNCSGPFLRGGYNPDQIIETGLCLEPKLAKQSRSAYDERIERLNESSTLTGAFFTSGAEPKPHIQKIYEAVITIAKSNGKALVFAHRNGKLHHLLKSKIEKMEYGSAVKIFPYSDREELDNLTAAHFNEFDYFVSPSHERTNWALGLGLPMFILDPPIGPFSPINRNFLLESGVAISVDFRTAEEFYWALDYHRKSGSLLRMSRAGWNRFPIDGFQTIADFLVNKLPLNT